MVKVVLRMVSPQDSKPGKQEVFFVGGPYMLNGNIRYVLFSYQSPKGYYILVQRAGGPF